METPVTKRWGHLLNSRAFFFYVKNALSELWSILWFKESPDLPRASLRVRVCIRVSCILITFPGPPRVLPLQWSESIKRMNLSKESIISGSLHQGSWETAWAFLLFLFPVIYVLISHISFSFIALLPTFPFPHNVQGGL